MRTHALTALVGFALCTPLVGCSGHVDEPGDSPYAMLPAELTPAASCEDLLVRLKADARERMHMQLDAMSEWAQSYDDNIGFAAGDPAEGSTGGGEDLNGSGGATAGGGGGGGDNAPDHSDTNTQVEGVDEADIVKTDGNYLYVLHGQALNIVEAFPASNMSMASSFVIEGYPQEMFLADDKIVVYSSVDGSAVYEAAGVEPRDPYYEGYYYGEGDVGGYAYFPSLTKVTILDVTGAQVSVAQEYYFEGWYSSSRRVGRDVRTVLQGGEHGPIIKYWPDYDYANPNGYPDTSLEWMMAISKLRAENEASIAAAKLEDFLPHRFAKTANGTELLPPSCTTYYTPTEGSTQYGMTEIAAINLDDPGSLTETSVVGYADVVYSSQDAMYLAARAYSPYSFGYVLPDVPTSTTATHIHKFDLTDDPKTPQYIGSGSVPGQLLNQFSMDEHEGVLRVATTDWLASQSTWDSINSVFTLRQNGLALEQAGSIRGLAAGETIYSTRFVGERGYVVTYRQVDPLFVLDLSDPDQPKAVAELKIPGFSEYMHPIDDGTKLLTIGREGNDQGQVFGVALQIFDVTDAKNPVLAHKYVFSDESWSGYSEASYNHKAFTYYNDMLAIPFESWDYEGTYGPRSTLEVFRIDADEGIEKLGSIDHSAFYSNQDPYSYCYGIGVRRGVFIEDTVYSVSYGGILANSLDDLSGAPVATLPFEPSQEECYYYY